MGTDQRYTDQVSDRLRTDLYAEVLLKFNQNFHMPHRIPLGQIPKLGFRFNLEVLSEKMEEIGENIGSTDTYTGPTLFLRGDRSEYITPNDLSVIKRHFPLATVETIDKAGHWLHAENPTQFFEKSILFIK